MIRHKPLNKELLIKHILRGMDNLTLRGTINNWSILINIVEVCLYYNIIGIGYSRNTLLDFIESSKCSNNLQFAEAISIKVIDFVNHLNPEVVFEYEPNSEEAWINAIKEITLKIEGMYAQ